MTRRAIVQLSDESARMPSPGEVWLCVEPGTLYDVRGWDDDTGPHPITGGTRTGHCAPHWYAHRVGAPESGYGCDPSVWCAIFPDAVKAALWIRVVNCPKGREVVP